MSLLAKSSNKPKLVIVSGAPGAGKTTLAKKLGRELNIITFSKDSFKELIFDASPMVNWIEEPYINALRIAGYSLLFSLAAEVLRTGNSVVLESNFKAQYDTGTISKLGSEYNAEIIEIHCFAPVETLFQRVETRAASGTRHSVHGEVVDTNGAFLQAYKQHNLDITPYRLDIGEVVDIDTSDFSKVDYGLLMKRLRHQVN